MGNKTTFGCSKVVGKTLQVSVRLGVFDNANNIDNTRTVERCSSLVMANSFL